MESNLFHVQNDSSLLDGIYFDLSFQAMRNRAKNVWKPNENAKKACKVIEGSIKVPVNNPNGSNTFQNDVDSTHVWER